jgi:hypothetical protein
MSYKKLNQININCDSFLSNIKFSNPISSPNSSNNKNISSPNSSNNKNISSPNNRNNRNISSPNNRNNRNISYNVNSGNNYMVNNIENESPNICFSNNKAALCKNIIKENKSCCC